MYRLLAGVATGTGGAVNFCVTTCGAGLGAGWSTTALAGRVTSGRGVGLLRDGSSLLCTDPVGKKDERSSSLVIESVLSPFIY